MENQSNSNEDFIKRLNEKGLQISEDGKIERKDCIPLVSAWVAENFMVALCFGNYSIGYDEDDYKKTRHVFKTFEQIEKMEQTERFLLFVSFATLIHNLKIEVKRLENQKNNKKKGQLLHEIVIGEEIDPAAQIAMTVPGIEYDWNKNIYKEQKIEIFKGSKKKPKVSEGLDLNKAAKIVSKRLNNISGKKKGIPRLVNKVADLTDFYLKKILPEITTPSIIRDLFSYVGLSGYDDITQIDNYIKRGRSSRNK